MPASSRSRKRIDRRMASRRGPARGPFGEPPPSVRAPLPAGRSYTWAMTAKHLLFESAARDAVLRGAAAMANAVKVTLGPKSKCVLIERRWDRPIVCNDGVTIAKEMELADPEENLGARMMREAAERTGEAVGDGTTTATLLAHAIFAEG